MKLIVGLGNYGAEYAKTRHNIGFMTVDLLAAKLGAQFSRNKFHAVIAEIRLEGEKALLMKPLTYMNKSGLAVAEAMNFYKLELADLLVIYDDMDMQCGQLRLRKKGSGGGHRGMGDIIAALGSDAIPRIKIGIDHPTHDSVVDFVLKPFTAEENEKITPALQLAADAALHWLTHDLQETMSIYNGYGKNNAKKPEPGSNATTAEVEPKTAETTADQAKNRENDPKFLAMLKKFFGGGK